MPPASQIHPFLPRWLFTTAKNNLPLRLSTCISLSSIILTY